ncbi:MAG: hypothetical protein RLZZ215_936 [Pseudomonadota bacterium]|jgi:hypothetical protein
MHKYPESVFEPLTTLRMLVCILILAVFIIMGGLTWLLA